MNLRSLVPCAILVMTAGCTFHSDQLSLVKTVIQAWSDSRLGSRDDAPWVAQYGLITRSVGIHVNGSLLTFANDRGDQVVVDNYRVQSIVGFGLAEPLLFHAESSARTSGKNQGVRLCYDWEIENLETGEAWHQTCGAQRSFRNKVLFDSEGHIMSLSQVVDASGTRLVVIRKGSSQP